MIKSKDSLRIDKWLWYARFFKNRTTTAKIVSQGKVRLNGKRIVKPSIIVKKGDCLTFQQGNTLRVVRVLSLGCKRGPAAEAKLLYNEVKEAIAVNEVIYSKKISINKTFNANLPFPDKRQRRERVRLKNLYSVDY